MKSGVFKLRLPTLLFARMLYAVLSLTGCNRKAEYPLPKDGPSIDALKHNVLLDKMYTANLTPARFRHDIYADPNVIADDRHRDKDLAEIRSISEAAKLLEIRFSENPTTYAVVRVRSLDPDKFNMLFIGWDEWEEYWVFVDNR